jgi:RHS repeat-associated protein
MARSCMDYGHHHLVSHHRNTVVEAPSQQLGACRHDESEEGHDVGNPYTLVSTYQYDPYGSLTSSTGSVANPWRFAGGYYDSGTGLYKFGARYYDSTLGRWTQQDPLPGKLTDPNSLNRYVYTEDDPVNLMDPRRIRVMVVVTWSLGATSTLAGALSRLGAMPDCTISFIRQQSLSGPGTIVRGLRTHSPIY